MALVGGLMRPLFSLREKGDIALDVDIIRQHLELPVLERFVWDEEDTWKSGATREQAYFSNKYGKVWDSVIAQLRSFMINLPGYDKGKLGQQQQTTVDMFNYIVSHLGCHRNMTPKEQVWVS